MTQEATNRFIDALKTGAGLKDEFIYYLSFSDYQMFPDPFPRQNSRFGKFKKASADTRIHKTPASFFSGIFMAGYSHPLRFPFPIPQSL